MGGYIYVLMYLCQTTPIHCEQAKFHLRCMLNLQMMLKSSLQRPAKDSTRRVHGVILSKGLLMTIALN